MRTTVCFLLILVAFAAPAGAAEGDPNAIFLVASEELRDPNFHETVVLVTQPREGGPWGVIINRPLEHRLSEIFTEFETLKDRKDVLFFGGPVAPDGLVFLVRSPKPPPRAVAVLRDVWFIGDVEWIEGLLRRPEPTRGLRVYAGYSGWAPGQLQAEIARGGWHVLPADAATVFEADSSRIWPELIKRATATRTLFTIGARDGNDQ